MSYLAVEGVQDFSDSWEWRPLRRVTRIRRETNADSSSRLLALSSDRGIEHRPDDGGRQLPSDETITGYWRVRPDDLVFNPMWAIGGGVAVSTLSGAVSTAYRIYEPGPSIWPRFLHYWLRSETAIEQYRLLVRGITTFDRSVTREDLDGMPIPVPPLATQRAIAEYLDRETTRIDALVAAKRRMGQLLEERWQGALEATIQALAGRFGETPLKHVCREIVVGIVITPSAWYADSGTLALRGTNVSAGTISLDDLVYLTPEGQALHPKSRLRSGDVVVVRTGQAGAAAVVPPELEGANCIDLVIIRVSRDYSPQFLECVLNSDWMQKHIDEHSVGTIQSHFNVGAASIVPVPRAPRAEQDTTVVALRTERQRVSRMSGMLSRQVALLQEHRQALITAAITGQLDIPEAS